MTAIQILSEQSRHAWAHKWESLRVVLEGVTEEEAAWQADCYAHEAQENGWPLPGTILWQVAHIEFCKRHYINLIRQRPDEDIVVVKRKHTKSFQEEFDRLKETQVEFESLLSSLCDDDLRGTVNGQTPLVEFLNMAIRHDVWHAGQISVLRRLWKFRRDT